jgi:hypothetical protein
MKAVKEACNVVQVKLVVDMRERWVREEQTMSEAQDESLATSLLRGS